MNVSLRSPALSVLAIAGIAVAVAGALVVAHGQGATPVRESAPSTPATPSSTPRPDFITGPRIVFRHTGLDARFGTVAMVSLRDPHGPRTFTGIACDRVAASATGASCLRTVRGVDTTFDLVEYDPNWSALRTVPMAGPPSRTRFSPDGSLVSTTTFVRGDSYEQKHFRTETEVFRFDGTRAADVSDFRLTIGGVRIRTHREVWGVTFVNDRSFYATASTLGTPYLVRGNLRDHTLTALRQGAECPSLSPDRTQVAYKVAAPSASPAAPKHWSVAVLDLATGHQRVLRRETASVDDQVLWLDDHTLLYGLPRVHREGVTDVWSIDTRGHARPHVFLPRAWSPTVVNP